MINFYYKVQSEIKGGWQIFSEAPFFQFKMLIISPQKHVQKQQLKTQTQMS
jgi:hypothetical protein